MDWKGYVGLAVFAVAVVLALVMALYASVSKYAKQFDPADRSPAGAPEEPGARR